MNEVVLNTPCGKIRGEQREGCRIFRGIPYALTKRFEKPVETLAWQGELDATKAGAEVYQYSAFYDEEKSDKPFYYNEFRKGMDFHYTEDYVTMNIVAPAKAENCPVLVFVHGGGHDTGLVGELPYGECEAYAKRGIVFVSVGYRENVFSMYRGRNLGLHDILCAFSWLKRCVFAFGGDGEKMTAMGQSAGAMSLTDICLCPKAKPFIKGAILMSGGGAMPAVAAPVKAEKMKKYWDAVEGAAGAENEAELKALPAGELWEAWNSVRSREKNLRLTQPAIDGEILRDSPAKLLRRGEQLDIPYMLGVTAQDFMPVVLYPVARRWAKRAARQGRAPCYCYLFGRTPPGDGFRAWHAADLWYMFGGMERSWRKFEERDFKLHELMADYVAGFVKTGNPNEEGLPRWEPISRKQKGFRLLDGESEGYAAPGCCRKEAWRTMLKDPGPM